jgi:hypothetical protein
VTGPAVVYLLCLMASVGCALLLTQAWRRTRAPLLLWSALCFGFLAMNNLFVFLDMVVVTSIDLSIVRQAMALAAICVMLYGFIWKVRP